MWPFTQTEDPDKIDIQLDFWGDAGAPSFTVKLVTEDQTALEGFGEIRGTDFRLCNIKTHPAYRQRGFCTTVVGTLIGAARARRCTTFTLEDVSLNNPEAIAVYQSFGAVALPPGKPGGHADYRLTL